MTTMPLLHPLLGIAGRLLAVAGALLAAAATWANQCAMPSSNGIVAGVSGVVNSYYPGTASAGAGATMLTLGASTGAGAAIAMGDLLLVIQMQGASIDSTNTATYGDGNGTGTYVGGYTAIGQTGRYEFVRAVNAMPATGGTVQIAAANGGGLAYSYGNAAPGATGGQQRFQVVKVPQYRAITLTGSITAAGWNGATGGVAAIDVAERLTFSGGGVNVSGLGFRGGGSRQLAGSMIAGASGDYRTLSTVNNNGPKGEGVAGTPRYLNNNGALLDNTAEGYPNGSHGRGGPGNAGGGANDGNPTANDQNSGGGGGANGGEGGKGGNAYCAAGDATCATSGGHPGAPVQADVARLVMGGGGGGGSSNNATGTPGAGFASSGAAGGGLVFIRAGEIAGAGTVAADGANANNTVLNDGSGGGGAGGSVLIATVRSVAGGSVAVNARGGTGGTNTGTGVPHGPGGGGGGGAVLSTATVAVTASIGGGANGTTANGALGVSYGATAGAGGTSGTITAANIPGLSSGGECTPLITKAFAAAAAPVGTSNRLTVSVRNNNPTLAMTEVRFTDTYPAGLVNAATPGTTNSCTPGTLTAAAEGPSLALAGGTVGAGATCAYSVLTKGTTPGVKLNTIGTGVVEGLYGTRPIGRASAATAQFEVQAPLAITKMSVAYSDPLNGQASPKAIPGGVVTYTITVSNTASYTVTTDTLKVTDATPAELQLVVADFGAAGSGPVAFQDGATSSTLTYGYTSLGSMTDAIEFSKVAGDWTYTPAPAADGTDPAVIAVRIGPRGAMAPGSSFTLRLRYRIR